MTSLLRLVIVVIVMSVAAGCRKAATPTGELLPGRSRPLLEHGWTHPRDLAFAANSFQPPDAKSSLVTTASGLRAYVVAADGDPVTQIVAAIPIGPARERADEAGASELISRLLQQDIGQRLGPDFVGRLQVEQDADVTRISVQTFANDWRPALAAIVSALSDARFESGSHRRVSHRRRLHAPDEKPGRRRISARCRTRAPFSQPPDRAAGRRASDTHRSRQRNQVEGPRAAVHRVGYRWRHSPPGCRVGTQ